MAKGNGILGFASGALGSIVFSRVKGQQIMKGRNNKPHNPRTKAQILHRARLSTLYKFTRLLPPGCLIGAFEDQRAKENWQSAFVRHNVKNAILQPKDWVEDETKAPNGTFVMSDGSISANLCTFQWNLEEELADVVGYNTGARLGITTIGHLSASMKDRHGLLEGDIVSFFIYYVGPYFIPRGQVSALIPREPLVFIESFKIDTSSAVYIRDYFKHVYLLNVPDDTGRGVLWIGRNHSFNNQPSMAIIVTRQDGKRTLSNTAHLVTPSADGHPFAPFETPTFILGVLRSWGMSRQAILDGAVLE